MNTGTLNDKESWVLAWQTKLHRWAVTDKEKKYEDIYNLVCDLRTLEAAWNHVKANKGSKTAGVDGRTRQYIETNVGIGKFLEDIRKDLKQGTYQPQPVRERKIPKRNNQFRYLGIPTLRDRVAQQALRMVLEPIFEADFYVSSYAYRPGRRAQDAIQDIYHLARPSIGYSWVIEGDIQGCFDHVHHGLLLQEIRRRVRDEKVIRIIRKMLKAGVITELGSFRKTITGTPQGGILSPLLANIYLSRLDRYFHEKWKRYKSSGNRRRLRKKGLATCYLVRFADDFVILVKGTREHAESLKEETAEILKRELRMELSLEKTHVTSIEQGFDFLGNHIVLNTNHRGQVGLRVYPSKRSLGTVQKKVKEITSISTTNLGLVDILSQLNLVLRGWCYYFRYAHSKKTFSYLGYYTWRRTFRWMRKKHPKLSVKTLKRRYCPDWGFREGKLTLFDVNKVKVERYGYRGVRIPTPWNGDLVNPKRQRRGDRLPDEPVLLGHLEDNCFNLKASGEPGA